MATEAEIIAAQKYYYDTSVLMAGKRIGSERDQWIKATQERKAYQSSLNPAELKIYQDANIAMNTAVQDQIDRDLATRSREHWQSFTKKAAAFVGAGFAAPALFGPGTGGVLGTGEAVAGSGASMDVAAAAMENQAWTDVASVAMENQAAASAGSWWDSLSGFAGDVVGVVPGAVNTLANILPKVSLITDYFNGEDEPALIPPNKAPVSAQPVTSPQPLTSTQPIFFQAPAAGSGQPNYYIYAAIAVAAYFLLR